MAGSANDRRDAGGSVAGGTVGRGESARRLPSFRAVLSGMMIVVVAVLVAAMAVLAWDAGHQAIDQTTQLLASEIARAVEEDLEILVDRPVRMVDRLAERLPREEGGEGAEAFREALREALDNTPEASLASFAAAGGGGLAALRLGGEIRFQPLAPEGRPPWYAAAAEAEGPVWGEVRLHEGYGALVLEVARAVRGNDGRLLGVIAGGFRLDLLEKRLAVYAEEQGAIAYLIDSSGRLLATHRGDTLREDGSRRYARDAEHPVAAAVALAVERGETGEWIVVDGEPYDAFVREVAKGLPDRWRLVVAVSRARFDAPLRRHLRTMAVLAFLALLGSVGLALWVARGAAKPLLEVARRAVRIRDGELEVEFRRQRVRELEYLSDSLRSMVGGLRERDRVKDAFARYVSPSLVEKVSSDPEALRPGGRLARAVVVFTDLRGFTALAERLGPLNTVSVINRYLDAMVAISDAHGGSVTDLLGDGMLIAFDVDGESDAPRRAVRCMLAMQQALDDIGGQCREEYGARLEMGAGAHLGEVIVGNIGSATRVKYGVIGDAVNTAARVESLTVGGEVLVSETVYQACGEDLDVEPPRVVPVKGKDEPLRVYGVRALRGADGLALPGAEPGEWLAADVAGEAHRLFGKVVGDVPLAVRVVAVEPRFMLIEAPGGLGVHDDLRLDVAGGTLYGQVRREESPGRWLIRWTGGAQDPVGLLRGRTEASGGSKP